MNQQLPATAEGRRTPTTIVAGMKPELAKSLPKHIDPDAFARTVQTALIVNPDLVQTTSTSLFTACMKAATDGLILDGREAALVIRSVKVSKKNEPDRWEKQAVYQPMVQGLMKLARNSGLITSITAQVVYANDKFAYVLGDEERIEHIPAPLTEERGAPIAGYAIVKLADGNVIREIMRGSEILNIGGQGQNSFQYDPARGKNFAEWWRKTLIRRITKYIPRSSDKVGAFHQAAERIDEDYDFDQEAQPPAPTPAPAKKRGAAAAKLKDVTPDPKPADPEPEIREPDFDPETGEVYQDRDDGQTIDHERQPGDDI